MSWLKQLWPTRSVVLVVDDGPTDSTPRLLDALEEAGHRAVMFVLGCNVAGREAVLVDAVRRGFALGNHSFSHPAFSQISLADAEDEIAQSEMLIEAIYCDARVARPGKWFRFPYLDRGKGKAGQFQELLRQQAFAVPDAVRRHDRSGDLDRRDWPSTVLTRDWALPTEEAFRACVQDAKAGDAIEFHDKVETIDRYLGILIEEMAQRRVTARVPGGER